MNQALIFVLASRTPICIHKYYSTTDASLRTAYHGVVILFEALDAHKVWEGSH